MNFENVIQIFGTDLGALVLSASMLAAYQYFLRLKLKRDPYYTVQAVNVEVRTEWVMQLVGKREIITGVQTLRNSTMAATFLASTAVLLIVGVLTLSEQGDKLGSFWHNINVWGAINSTAWTIKILAILIDLFVAFFAFSMSIRTYNHVGFMLYVPAHTDHEIITKDYVAHQLNRAGSYYSIGMRSYYYLVPLIFWMFGPQYMLLGTLGLVIALSRFDRAPKGG